VKQRPVLHTLAALTPPVLGAMAVAVAGLWGFRWLIPQEALQASNAEVGNYLQVLGTIYAVLLAFVVFVVWQQFDVARGLVEREANEIADLYRSSEGLPVAERSRLRQHLAGYVDAVLDQEWTAMSSGEEAVIARTGAHLDRAWAALHECAPATDCEHTVWSDALARLNDLSDLRADRLTSARTRIPLALKFLLYSGAVTTVASMWMLAVDRFVIHAVITAALAGAIAHVIYLIGDLDNPFDGDWQVPRSPFVRVRGAIAEHQAAGVDEAAA
jgi:hypothetical protein